MLKSLSGFVDYPLVRFTLIIGGLYVTGLFGLFCAVRVLEFGSWRMLELGGLLGLAGWWIRVCIRINTFKDRPRLRLSVLALLLTGVASSLVAASVLPSSYHAFLAVVAVLGILLFVGSLEALRSNA